MSKGREDWKGGPESLFQAARTDHEATASDYARVEAELARRLAAGALPKRPLDVAEPAITAKPGAALAPSTVAKLGVAALLLAAGSFAAVRILDRTSEASLPPSAAAPTAADTDQPLDTAPAVTATEPQAVPQPQARHEKQSRATLRSWSAPRRASSSQSAIASAESNAAEKPAIAGTEVSPTQPISSRSTSTRQPKAVAIAQAEPARAPAALDQETESQPAAAESRVRIQPKPQTRPAPKSIDARAELALVERMQAAMRAAKPREALELCAEHATRWPQGVFAEEREGVHAIASCTLRAGDAVESAQVFLHKHPRAPMAARVAAACAPLLAATKPAATH